MDKKELEELGICSYDHLQRAIEAGDQEKALQLLEEIKQGVEFYTLKRTRWIDLLFRFIQEKLGDEGVIEAQLRFDKELVRPYLVPEGVDPAKWSAEDKVRARARGWMFQHLMTKNMQIDEDEEKFTFRIPCNTAGPLKMTGKYAKTKEAVPSLGIEEGFPLYCVQSIITEVETLRQLGFPLWFSERKERGEDGCVLYIYKDTGKVPKEYFESLGFEKKER